MFSWPAPFSSACSALLHQPPCCPCYPRRRGARTMSLSRSWPAPAAASAAAASRAPRWAGGPRWGWDGGWVGAWVRWAAAARRRAGTGAVPLQLLSAAASTTQRAPIGYGSTWQHPPRAHHGCWEEILQSAAPHLPASAAMLSAQMRCLVESKLTGLLGLLATSRRTSKLASHLYLPAAARRPAPCRAPVVASRVGRHSVRQSTSCSASGSPPLAQSSPPSSERRTGTS